MMLNDPTVKQEQNSNIEQTTALLVQRNAFEKPSPVGHQSTAGRLPRQTESANYRLVSEQTNQDEEQTKTVDALANFGWEQIIDGPLLPFVKRGSQELVANLIADKAINSTLKSVFTDAVKDCISIECVQMSKNEADVYNEINIIHCDRSLAGNHIFNAGEPMTNLEDIKKFVAFSNACKKAMIDKEKKNPMFGFLQIAGESCVPFVFSDTTKKLVPLFYFEGQSDYLDKRCIEITDLWKLGYFKFCCKVQKLRKEFYEVSALKVVDFDDVKKLFPEETSFELYWPENVNEDLLAPEIRLAALFGLEDMMQINPEINNNVSSVSSALPCSEQAQQELHPSPNVSSTLVNLPTTVNNTSLHNTETAALLQEKAAFNTSQQETSKNISPTALVNVQSKKCSTDNIVQNSYPKEVVQNETTTSICTTVQTSLVNITNSSLDKQNNTSQILINSQDGNSANPIINTATSRDTRPPNEYTGELNFDIDSEIQKILNEPALSGSDACDSINTQSDVTDDVAQATKRSLDTEEASNAKRPRIKITKTRYPLSTVATQARLDQEMSDKQNGIYQSDMMAPHRFSNTSQTNAYGYPQMPEERLSIPHPIALTQRRNSFEYVRGPQDSTTVTLVSNVPHKSPPTAQSPGLLPSPAIVEANTSQSQSHINALFAMNNDLTVVPISEQETHVSRTAVNIPNKYIPHNGEVTITPINNEKEHFQSNKGMIDNLYNYGGQERHCITKSTKFNTSEENASTSLNGPILNVHPVVNNQQPNVNLNVTYSRPNVNSNYTTNKNSHTVSFSTSASNVSMSNNLSPVFNSNFVPSNSQMNPQLSPVLSQGYFHSMSGMTAQGTGSQSTTSSSSPTITSQYASTVDQQFFKQLVINSQPQNIHYQPNHSVTNVGQREYQNNPRINSNSPTHITQQSKKVPLAYNTSSQQMNFQTAATTSNSSNNLLANQNRCSPKTNLSSGFNSQQINISIEPLPSVPNCINPQLTTGPSAPFQNNSLRNESLLMSQSTSCKQPPTSNTIPVNSMSYRNLPTNPVLSTPNPMYARSSLNMQQPISNSKTSPMPPIHSSNSTHFSNRLPSPSQSNVAVSRSNSVPNPRPPSNMQQPISNNKTNSMPSIPHSNFAMSRAHNSISTNRLPAPSQSNAAPPASNSGSCQWPPSNMQQQILNNNISPVRSIPNSNIAIPRVHNSTSTNTHYTNRPSAPSQSSNSVSNPWPPSSTPTSNLATGSTSRNSNQMVNSNGHIPLNRTLEVRPASSNQYQQVPNQFNASQAVLTSPNQQHYGHLYNSSQQHQFFVNNPNVNGTNNRPVNGTNIGPVNGPNIRPVNGPNIRPINDPNIRPVNGPNNGPINGTNNGPVYGRIDSPWRS